METGESNVPKSSKELKSIMKNSKKDESAGKETEPETEGAKSAKRGVKILEKINDKNDQLTNLKIDNKTKHSASTSTPTARRRPLKAPQDVSLIDKS